jgi:hypothetical protein
VASGADCVDFYGLFRVSLYRSGYYEKMIELAN